MELETGSSQERQKKGLREECWEWVGAEGQRQKTEWKTELLGRCKKKGSRRRRVQSMLTKTGQTERLLTDS